MHTAGISPVRQRQEIGECAGEGFLHFGLQAMRAILKLMFS